MTIEIAIYRTVNTSLAVTASARLVVTARRQVRSHVHLCAATSYRLMMAPRCGETERQVAAVLTATGRIAAHIHCSSEWAVTRSKHNKIAPLSWAPSNTCFHGPTRVHTPDSMISIGSAVLAHLVIVSSSETDHGTSVTIGRIFALCACDAPVKNDCWVSCFSWWKILFHFRLDADSFL